VGFDTEWLKLAQSIATGSKTRIEHDCGGGKAAIVNNLPKGYSVYCNRCGHTDFVHKGQRTFQEIMQQRKRDLEDADSIRGSTNLPDDFSLEIPPEAMLWLLKANITPYIARAHGIGWSKRYQRVVLPVYNNNILVFYQMRAIHKHQTIKYLNPSVDRKSIAYWVHPVSNLDTLDRIVITEDILSAIRVGKHIPTVSMLGTKISIQQAEQISKYKRATTWLDPDEAGITGAAKMRKTLRVVMYADNKITNVDPKELPDRLIKQYLRGEDNEIKSTSN